MLQLRKQPNSSSTTSSDSMDYPKSSYPTETPNSPANFGKPYSKLPTSNSQYQQLSILRLMAKQNEQTELSRTCYEPSPTINKTTGKTTSLMPNSLATTPLIRQQD